MRKKTRLTVRNDSTDFGRRLTDRMAELGLDDEDVAAATGLHYSTVRSVRRRADKKPKLETAALIADAVKSTTDWLLHGRGAAPGAVPSHLPRSSGADNDEGTTWQWHLEQAKELYAAERHLPPEQVTATLSVLPISL